MKNYLVTLENNLINNTFKLDESIETILINESSHETRKDQVLAIQNTLTGLQKFTNIYLKDKTPKAKQDMDFYFKSYIKLVQHMQAAHMVVHSRLINLTLDEYFYLASKTTKLSENETESIEPNQFFKTETVSTVESPKSEETKEVLNKDEESETETKPETKPVAKTIKAK